MSTTDQATSRYRASSVCSIYECTYFFSRTLLLSSSTRRRFCSTFSGLLDTNRGHRWVSYFPTPATCAFLSRRDFSIPTARRFVCIMGKWETPHKQVYLPFARLKCMATCRRCINYLEHSISPAMTPCFHLQLPVRSYSVVDNEVWQMTEMRRWFDAHSSPQAPGGFDALASGYTVEKVWALLATQSMRYGLQFRNDEHRHANARSTKGAKAKLST